jgi:hypothetical protein
MALGPFVTYVPPGVYTRTLTEANVSNLVAGLRIPVIIGVGQEELEQDDIELVRGSSATVDELIVNEDVSLSWVVDATNPNNLVLGAQNGQLTQFRVKNFPIVDGQGIGRTTNDTRSVTVTVNGTPVAVASVQGAKGLVGLQIPTQPTDTVRATYHFHRGDTSFTDDVSGQVTSTNATLTSPGFEPFLITAGSNDNFVLTVNGVQATVTLPPGSLTAAGVVSAIMAAAIPNLLATVFVDNAGLNHILLTATQSIVIGSGTANGPLGFSSGAQTSRNAQFRLFNIPIVDGSGGGITTTDPTKVVVKVNNVQVVASAVDGKNGVVTLPFAPAPGSTVSIQYFANTWQQTFDYLPNSNVTQVIRAGISPQRNDYIQGADFTIANPTPDVSLVNWGTGVVTQATKTSPGAAPFDGVSGLGGQIGTTLVDDKMFLAACTPVTDTTTIPATVSATQFLLPEIPTTGNGRDTPLGLPLYNSVTNGRMDLVSNRPDLVTVYAGRNLRDALGRAAIPVIAVDGPNRVITLQRPVPPDYTVFATFWYNNIVDDTYILTCTVPGPIGSGQYTVFSSLRNANLFEVRFGTKSGFAQTVQWPRGVENIPDAFHTGNGTPVAEIVTITFSQSAPENAAFTNRNAEPYSFFAPYSATWVTVVNGGSQTTTLSNQAKGFLVGGHVTPIQTGPDTGKITIPASPNNAFNVQIDGVTVATINLTAGNRTPAQIVSEINTGIDANAAFVGTAPNNLCSSVQIGGPGTGDIIFIIKSYSTPAALPGGFDAVSTVKILQGTVEHTLGFKTFQAAAGTPGAINKPATLLSGLAGPYNITAGLNDKLLLRVNGTDYSVTLPAGAAVSAASVVTAIGAVSGLGGVPSSGTLGNANHVRLTSLTNDANSSILIQNGSANAVLGFTQNQFASQALVTAQEVVDELMATGGFAAGAVAYVDALNSKNYITIESLTTGASGSSIGFAASANSAFNTSTGIGLTPGVDGDVGEDAHDQYTVSSSSPNGSAGTGVPGQTYTDAVTGLRFTILPASTGGYTPAGNFTLLVSPTFHVDPSVPRLSIPGIEMIVSNTVNVAVNDTGVIQTFNPGGLEPAVGDFYFISYRYKKQDFSTRIFQTLKTIEANFGATSPENRVSLAAYLAILNGAVLIGITQVLKVPNTNQASDQSFINAIAGLATPLPGNVKPDILVPLATSTAVYSFLTNHCEVQSNIRNQAERMGFIGFASGTSPTSAQTIAKSLVSSRIVAFYPDSSVVTLTDETGQSFQSIIDGSFFGAAVAGAVVAPSVDVATPYTRRRLQGFTSIPRILDPVEATQTAVAGITLLEDLGNGFLRIRQGLTTNMASILTRLPTVTQISDFVQQQSRTILDSFVGTKFLQSRTTEVVVTMTGLFKSLVQAEIVAAFTGLSAQIDPNDPTILNFQAFYAPIFPLEYLVLTFNLRANI